MPRDRLVSAQDTATDQLSRQAALAGQRQPARTGPLRELAQQLPAGSRQLRAVPVLLVRHTCHSCLPFITSYTVKITASLRPPRSRAIHVLLCRLRYVGSASQWQFAIYRASHDDYDESVFFTGLPVGTCQDALDTACGLYFNDPTAWTRPPTNLRARPLSHITLAVAASRCLAATATGSQNHRDRVVAAHLDGQ
jgi:hypothetical protein